MKLPTSSTLSLSFLPGQTFALALCILALIAGASEAAARLWLDGSSVPEAVGSANTVFDQKIGILDELVEREGRVDCILLGSSVVLNALDPDLVAEAYTQHTGEPLACYNFGIPALSSRTAGLIAELLVERYQPRLLVYGLTLRAVADGVWESGRIYNDVAGTPWVRYERGTFSVAGWLTAHSSAFRHFLAYRNWTQHEFSNRLSEHKNAPRDGYMPFDARSPLDPAAITTPSYFAPFVMSPQELAGLDQVLALQGQTRVVLVDMPLPLFFREGFDGGAAAYQGHITDLDARGAEWGVPLWQTNPLDMIPDDHWAKDGQHVNGLGARILSGWLGEQIAALEQGGAAP
jgi:hypothetical protein